jgi:hypothetical protein
MLPEHRRMLWPMPAIPRDLWCDGEQWIRNGRQSSAICAGRCRRPFSAVPGRSGFVVGCFERALVRDQGGFDERLPACEDYDLYLRLAARVPFGLVARDTVIKFGGHADQLSRTTWGLDRFRVFALVKLLDDPVLTPERRQMVRDNCMNRLVILADGARRRGRHADVTAYARWAEALDRPSSASSRLDLALAGVAQCEDPICSALRSLESRRVVAWEESNVVSR